MAELRTYVGKTAGATVALSVSTLPDGRVRVDERSGSTLKASQLLSRAEADALIAALRPAAPPAPDPAPAAQLWDARSPWNTPIPAGAATVPNSATTVAAVGATGPLTSDPRQYAGPIYEVDFAATPNVTVHTSGTFHDYPQGDTKPCVTLAWGDDCSLPIPRGVVPSNGSDAHVILRDSKAQIEMGFWQFEWRADGSLDITNGYRTSYAAGNFGTFRDGKSGRGAGTPYGAGCVTRADFDSGEIKHALAFAANLPYKTGLVYPASKTDGKSDNPHMPIEGARFQLDPAFDVNTLPPELDGSGKVIQGARLARMIARALQTHGMYVIDCSGRNKLYLEDAATAKWDSSVTDQLVASIPWTAYRIVEPPAVP